MALIPETLKIVTNIWNLINSFHQDTKT